MQGILIYSEEEARRNAFVVQKYLNALPVRLVLQENLTLQEPADFVLNRTDDWRIAAAFEQRGVRVFNSARVSRYANDKALAYDFMQRSGVEILPVHYSGFPAVLKKSFSKGGKDVRLVHTPGELPADLSGYVLQQPCDTLGKDLRVYVIGGQIVVACLRTGAGFLSNYCLGGKAEVYTLSDAQRAVVEQVIALFDFDFVGIDFLFHQGRLVFNEMEDAVGARMVYDLTDLDIVSLYCRYVWEQMEMGGYV